MKIYLKLIFFFSLFQGRSINRALIFSYLTCAYTDVCLSVWNAKARREINWLK